MPRMVVLPERAKAPLRPVIRRYRLATSRFRILPAFLIIGAQRAGTTSLFHYLSLHPDVAMPSPRAGPVRWAKEPHFFDEKFSQGLDWYRAFFPLAAARDLRRRRGGDLLAGEATPYYLFHPAVPARVAATLPDVRLIALLRDPVERAYSHYHLMERRGRERLSFEAALDAEEERLAQVEHALFEEQEIRTEHGFRAHDHHRHRSYLSRGLYAEQLERWLAYFPRGQLLVLRAEDFLARPAEIYGEVLEFLGLRSWSPSGFGTRNPGGSRAPIDPALRARLEEQLAEPNARLARLLGRDFGWGPRRSPDSASAEISATGADRRAG
jgi:hypothetical protein